jgi:hypothetical protein
MLEKRGDLDRLTITDPGAALACHNRARARLDAARVLMTAQHWAGAAVETPDSKDTKI